jgi:adenosylcobinamide-phosphate synthase
MDNIYNQTMTLLPEFAVFITLSLALLVDKVFGESSRFHYLVGFGWLANKLEAKLNTSSDLSIQSPFNGAFNSKLLGTFVWCLLVLPLPLIYWYCFNDLIWYWQICLDATVLYLAMGLNSLYQHAMQIYQPLKSGDLEKARHFTGYIVSRQTNELSEQEMSRATVESMLENGHDSVIASMIYYIIGGAPLVILHRLANTLDAMWGYRTARFNDFGYASAKLDDLLGFISGKCCTLLYAIQGLKHGRVFNSLRNAYSQGNKYKSHNGGWVMAAGATVMGLQLGGSALYHGKKINSVTLGLIKDVLNNPEAINNAATVDDIPLSLTLVTRASLLLLSCVLTFSIGIKWL